MSAPSYLKKELKELPKSLPQCYIELKDDNILNWSIGIYIGDKDSRYNGAYLRAQMTFPMNYPFSPPNFKFVPSIYHPNVYRDGKVCISILHEAGNVTTGEPDNETWSAAQSVESVLLSIISILEDPNPDSPANVDAAKLYRKDKEEYYKVIERDVERSKQNIPEDFIVPKLLATSNQGHSDYVEDDWFFDEEEEEDDFEEDDEEDDEEEEENEGDDQSFAENEDVEMSEDDEVSDLK